MKQIEIIGQDIVNLWRNNKEEFDKLSPEVRKSIEDIVIKTGTSANYFYMKHISAPMNVIGKRLGYDDSECVDIWLEHGANQPEVHFVLRYPHADREYLENGVYLCAENGYVEESDW